MSQTMSLADSGPGAWSWWESRRFSYNLALAFAGWGAYGVTIGLFYGFGHAMWLTWQAGLSTTLFLGTGFLIVMGVANIFYLLGATTESIVAPADRTGFRKHAYALGFWGSVALPFVFPLANLAFLVGNGPI